MRKPSGKKNRWVWLYVLILVISVTATTIALVKRLNGFLLDDSGAIPLIQERSSAMSEENVSGTITQSAGNSEQSVETNQTIVTKQPVDTEGETNSSITATISPQDLPESGNPGFEAGDEKTVWTTNTQVEIFRVSYVNGEQVITVTSNNEEKVIAPGTENSYTFKLKNTGNAALDYTVTVDAFFSSEDIEIPISGKLNRYDGKWIVGDKDNYVDIPTLDTAEDKATLGAGRYTYYTLEWVWPFESGDDELDTMLGNLASEQDLTLTIVISTTATESANPDDDNGIVPPETGDDSKLILWVILIIGSILMMIYLSVNGDKEDTPSRTEAKGK